MSEHPMQAESTEQSPKEFLCVSCVCVCVCVGGGGGGGGGPPGPSPGSATVGCQNSSWNSDVHKE